MMSDGFTVVGMEKLQKKLTNNVNLKAVKDVVRMNGSELQDKSMRNAPVDTGTLKRSIGLEIVDGGLTAVVEPTVEYAPYVELGTRFMDPQPYLKPAFEKQSKQFRKDMGKLVR